MGQNSILNQLKYVLLGAFGAVLLLIQCNDSKTSSPAPFVGGAKTEEPKPNIDPVPCSTSETNQLSNPTTTTQVTKAQTSLTADSDEESSLNLTAFEADPACPIQPIQEPEYCRDIKKAWEAKDKEIACSEGVRFDCYPDSCNYLLQNDFTCGRLDDDTAPRRTHNQCGVFIKTVCLHNQDHDPLHQYEATYQKAIACWNGDKSVDWSSLNEVDRSYIGHCIGYFIAKKMPKIKAPATTTPPTEEPKTKTKKKKEPKPTTPPPVEVPPSSDNSTAKTPCTPPTTTAK